MASRDEKRWAAKKRADEKERGRIIRSGYDEKLKLGTLTGEEQKRYWQLLHADSPKRGRPNAKLKIRYYRYVDAHDEMVNTAVERGIKDPVEAAFADFAQAENCDIKTIKKYYRAGVKELREFESRTAAEIDALIAAKRKQPEITDPKRAAFEEMARRLGKTALIIERIYKRASKHGKKFT
jgi:hypothetical protein